MISRLPSSQHDHIHCTRMILHSSSNMNVNYSCFTSTYGLVFTSMALAMRLDMSGTCKQSSGLWTEVMP